MSVDVKLNPVALLKSPWEWYPAGQNATQNNITPMMLPGHQTLKAGPELILLKIFPSQFKSNGNLILVLSKYSMNNICT